MIREAQSPGPRRRITENRSEAKGASPRRQVEVARAVSSDAVDVVGGIPLGVGLHVHELDREGRAPATNNRPGISHDAIHGLLYRKMRL